MAEYDILPSPLRKEYLTNQALNPSAPLTYVKKILIDKDIDGGILNSTTETSIFNLLSPLLTVGGPEIDTSLANLSNLTFPRGLLVSGSMLRLTFIGEITKIGATGGRTITFRGYGLNSSSGWSGTTLHALNISWAGEIRNIVYTFLFRLSDPDSSGDVISLQNAYHHVGGNTFTSVLSYTRTISDLNNTFLSLMMTAQWGDITDSPSLTATTVLLELL